MAKSKVVVVGAGIIGLSSAVAIQDTFPNTKVTIVADKLSPEVTSDLAAGFWWPYLVEGDQQLIKSICSSSFSYIVSLLGDAECGALWQSGYEVSVEEEGERPLWADIVKGFRTLSRHELAAFGPQYKSGRFFTTLGLEPTKYLKWITHKFEDRGGRIVKKKLKSLREIEDADVVVNCCGLGAIELLNDKLMSPVRGQIIRVRAPRVKHFFTDGDNYCLLNGEFVVLGGTHEEGQWDTTPDINTANHILQRNTQLIPELKGAEVISHHVGLRPCRTKLRLEVEETLMDNGRMVPVIHNYGHGGSGITLFWGSAMHVTSLAAPFIQHSRL